MIYYHVTGGELALFICQTSRHPYGDALVSTGVWNEDKRAVAVIHVKSTRLKETQKQTTISHWLHSSAPRVGPDSPAGQESGVMHAGNLLRNLLLA